jgi:hypothetical protein
MKVAKSGKNDFKDIQIQRKVMMVFLIISDQILRLKLNSPNQTCISLNSVMQLTKTIFPDSATLIEKKRVEN